MLSRYAACSFLVPTGVGFIGVFLPDTLKMTSHRGCPLFLKLTFSVRGGFAFSFGFHELVRGDLPEQ
jgi:hypothetical protein